MDARLARAALLADERDQRVGELRTAAARDRHAAFLHGDRDHLRHVAGGRRVRAEAGVQHPRREQTVRALGDERRLEPVARRDEQPAREVDRPAPAEPAKRLQPERSAVTRPELGAEDPEREVGVREEVCEQRVPRSTVAWMVAIELGGVRVGGALQERAAAVGEERAGRQLRVQVLEAVPRQVVAELARARRRRPRVDARR